MTAMQFGVFSTGYLDQEPAMTGPVVHAHQTIKETMLLARHAEEVGLDVFAHGEHHNQPFWSSSPPVILSYLAASTTTLQLSTSATLITTNDPVRLAEEYALLQHLSDGRVDLVLGRGNTGPVYPWSSCSLTVTGCCESQTTARNSWTSSKSATPRSWKAGQTSVPPSSRRRPIRLARPSS